VATIETRRLILRPPAPTDAAAITRAIDDDPEITTFIPAMPVPYTDTDARKWLEGIPGRWETIREVPFAITEPDADEMIGAIAVRLQPGGSIGYWLAEPSRGQGLMTEALIAVVRWSAAEHGIRDLHLTMHPDNQASQRVAEKAGFVHAGLVIHEPPFGDGGMRAVRFERPR
jgi:RimJ/RimL family protein N-acetyltransferase